MWFAKDWPKLAAANPPTGVPAPLRRMKATKTDLSESCPMRAFLRSHACGHEIGDLLMKAE
jgi:hypothetical protein